MGLFGSKHDAPYSIPIRSWPSISTHLIPSAWGVRICIHFSLKFGRSSTSSTRFRQIWITGYELQYDVICCNENQNFIECHLPVKSAGEEKAHVTWMICHRCAYLFHNIEVSRLPASFVASASDCLGQVKDLTLHQFFVRVISNPLVVYMRIKILSRCLIIYYTQ